jgi:hypothetical protein
MWRVDQVHALLPEQMPYIWYVLLASTTESTTESTTSDHDSEY